MSGPLKLAILAGEVSGDELGGALMSALAAAVRSGAAGPAFNDVAFRGVGGETMVRAGLQPVFPMEAIAVNGFDAIVRRLPQLLGRIREAADMVVDYGPDALIIVDAPEFNHRVAQRVRRRRPRIPIANYVSPTVWAWRPGRAKAMRPYVDRVLALFPFEPEVHRRLGGPETHYVGHPLFEALRAERSPEGEALLVLPGSRRGEIERLMPDFGAAVAELSNGPSGERPVELLAVSHLESRIRELAAAWPRQPRILSGPGAKEAAFAGARAALAASGTVTLELAAARIPMAVAYRLDGIGKAIKAVHPVIPIVKAPSMVLANIVLGRNVIPAFLDDEGSPQVLAATLAPLLAGGPARQAQQSAFDDFHAAMAVEEQPAKAAARVVLDLIALHRTSVLAG